MIDGKPAVAVCVPVAGDRNEAWWAPLVDSFAAWTLQDIRCALFTATSGMLDLGKNIALDHLPELKPEMVGKSDANTAANRNALSQVIDQPENGFDYVFFMDHDTVPESDVLPRLLALDRPFACGVYYHRNDPHLPLMYRKQPSGLYTPIRDFERGALFEVDATGLGVALISVKVFKAIRENYRLFERWNGSQVLIHKDDIHHEDFPSKLRCETPQAWENSRGLYQVVPLHEVPTERQGLSPFPYFDMETLRTEDIGFCEKAIRCGFRPVVDTSIEATHWHWLPIDGQMFRALREGFKVNGYYTPTTAPGGVQ